MTEEITDKPTIGILGYGSLISDPGTEITNAYIDIIEDVMTPFHVEFARSSNGRGGAPTLVPVLDGGAQVKGQLFVMDLPEQEAADILYRRETNRVGEGRTYKRPKNIKDSDVLIERLTNFAGLDVVLYTKIAATIDPLTPNRLSDLAIESVDETKTDLGRDGITYLIDAKRHGIVTALSPAYEAEILRKTECECLDDALVKLQNGANRSG